MITIWVYGSEDDEATIETLLEKYASDTFKQYDPTYNQGVEYKVQIAEDAEVALLALDLEELGGWISSKRQVGFKTIQVSAPEAESLDVIAHPTGEIGTTGAGVATGGGGVIVIATRTITDGKTYHICNLRVSCKTAHWLYLFIGGTERRRYYNAGEGDTVDWFAWDWHPLLGDGSTKKIELKAQKDDGGETLYGDFCGEEI